MSHGCFRSPSWKLTWVSLKSFHTTHPIVHNPLTPHCLQDIPPKSPGRILQVFLGQAQSSLLMSCLSALGIRPPLITLSHRIGLVNQWMWVNAPGYAIAPEFSPSFRAETPFLPVCVPPTAYSSEATRVPSHSKETCMYTNVFRVANCGLSMNFCMRTFVVTLGCFWTSVSSSVWKEVWLSRPWELRSLVFSELGLLRELASEHPAAGTVAEPKGSSWQLHKTAGPVWGCRWLSENPLKIESQMNWSNLESPGLSPFQRSLCPF